MKKFEEMSIAELREMYDRELARQPKDVWVPSTRTGTQMPDEEYQDLRFDSGTEVLDDAAARKWIAEEFGFQTDLIHFVSRVYLYTVNQRSHVLRKAAVYVRESLHNSSDWNYFRFDVQGISYEVINGSLIMVRE